MKISETYSENNKKIFTQEIISEKKNATLQKIQEVTNNLRKLRSITREITSNSAHVLKEDKIK